MATYADDNKQQTKAYAEMSQDQLMAKLTDDKTSPDELEEIMAFLARKDSEAQEERASIVSRLNEQEGGPQLGEGLTTMHNAMGEMSKVVGAYAKNNEEGMAKWDLVHAEYKAAVLEMIDLYEQRRDLLYSVRVSLKDTADKLVPNMELDPTKDPWEEMARSNKEVEDTEAAFKKEMEKVSSFTKAYHDMPEYKELTAKLGAVKERIAAMEAEFHALMAADDIDMANVADAMKEVEAAGKNL